MSVRVGHHGMFVNLVKEKNGSPCRYCFSSMVDEMRWRGCAGLYQNLAPVLRLNSCVITPSFSSWRAAIDFSPSLPWPFKVETFALRKPMGSTYHFRSTMILCQEGKGMYTVLGYFESRTFRRKQEEVEKKLVPKETGTKKPCRVWHLHSQLYRLVAPYAYGAVYNHPLEDLMVDTAGGGLAVLLSCMSLLEPPFSSFPSPLLMKVDLREDPLPQFCKTALVPEPFTLYTVSGTLAVSVWHVMSSRTSMFIISFATIKTVDDHCRFWLTGNLFDFFFQNNTACHYIHHQLYGSKYNFSGPFFNMMVIIFGTYMPYSYEKKAGARLLRSKAIKEKRDD
ncbi:unnamed protein product [Dovyalis caffra]|uniref:Uncharacterized protein n=1 Tax=Dovyalis caffra TaxID=77055 RepID=A0AAV1QYW3_9ROSI|nr:unnamed protein product [Dovyalis caffra]